MVTGATRRRDAVELKCVPVIRGEKVSGREVRVADRRHKYPRRADMTSRGAAEDAVEDAHLLNP